jgi:hypothetical protein
MLSSNCFAGKIKSSKNFLPKIESEIKDIQTVIADIKTYIIGVGETGSFVKNDFWGIKPVFSLKYGSDITSLYLFHETIDESIQREIKNKSFFRTINNIRLNPEKVEDWRAILRFKYYIPSNEDGGDYFTKYLLSNGVSTKNIKSAINEYIEAYDKLFNVFSNKVFLDIDNLYSEIYIGAKYLDDKFIFKYFDEKTFFDMSLHPKIMKENIEDFRLSSLHQVYELKTRDDFFKALYDSKIELNINISNVRYFFEVGQYLDRSQKASQIIDFDLLLNKKVEQGKAVKVNIEKGRNRGFVAYSDTKGSVKYPATIYFNKGTGKGIWENGYWKSKDDLKILSDRLNKKNAKLQESIKKYLEMVRKEIARKYASRLDSTGFTDEF